MSTKMYLILWSIFNECISGDMCKWALSEHNVNVSTLAGEPQEGNSVSSEYRSVWIHAGTYLVSNIRPATILRHVSHNTILRPSRQI